MDYKAFSNESLTLMHESVRGALAADDALRELGRAPRFRVRETLSWKFHAASLEAEMFRRGTSFDIIDWSEASLHIG